MQAFNREALVTFLSLIDRELTAPTSVIIIGGAAASLAYHAQRTTTDIDLLEAASKEFEEALNRVKKAGHDVVPVSPVGVWDAPYSYEDRLVRILESELKHIQAFVPDVVDLALMKIVRCYENDIQVLCEIHARQPFDRPILVERFRTEMTHCVKSPAILKSNFVLLCERLYGARIADEIESRLGG